MTHPRHKPSPRIWVEQPGSVAQATTRKYRRKAGEPSYKSSTRQAASAFRPEWHSSTVTRKKDMSEYGGSHEGRKERENGLHLAQWPGIATMYTLHLLSTGILSATFHSRPYSTASASRRDDPVRGVSNPTTSVARPSSPARCRRRLRPPGDFVSFCRG